MKKLVLSAIIILSTIVACTPESPRVQVQNNSSQVVDVALKPPSGSTININDVSGGNKTSYIEVPSSNYEVDVNVENVTPSATTHFRVDEDGNYTIVVSNTTPPTISIRQ
jgi:hypothetical protein